MKVRIEIVPELEEAEVVIRTPAVTNEIAQVQQAVTNSSSGMRDIVFYKEETEFYFPIEKILFFETEGSRIYAHTAKDEYEVKYKLYELEEKLPSYFMRVSKSTILNTRKVFGLTKNITASSRVDFAGTEKCVFVSRNYIKSLRSVLNPLEK